MNLNKLVILSAGHSPTREGAVFGDLKESQETIAIVDICAGILKEKGIPYRIVPHELGLTDTIKWINERYKNLGDALCVDVHKNFGGGKGTGIETFYVEGNNFTKRIAEIINKEIVKSTGLADRGARPDTLAVLGSLRFLRQINTFGVLCEMGFIDNPIDNRVSRQKYAEGLANGIMAVFQNLPSGLSGVKENQEKLALKEIVEVLKKYKII